MKTWGLAVAVVVVSLTSACGSDSSPTKGGTAACYEISQGAGKFQSVIDGSKNGTMTDADAAAAMGKAADHFNSAVSFGGQDSRLLGLIQDAATQAGQMRVSLLGDGSSVASNTTTLISDLNDAEDDCGIKH